MVWEIPGDLGAVWRRFSAYSFHNANAGRIWNWHIPVLAMYMAAIALVALGFFASPVFYAVVIGGLIARTAKKIFSNRREKHVRAERVPAHILFTAFLIVFIDAAMFAGWWRSCVLRVRSRKLGAGSHKV
jgi:hypothetical protein